MFNKYRVIVLGEKTGHPSYRVEWRVALGYPWDTQGTFDTLEDAKGYIEAQKRKPTVVYRA